MAAGNNLFSSTEQYRLRQALQKFGKVFGLKDQNTFMQILLRSTQGAVKEEPSPTGGMQSVPVPPGSMSALEINSSEVNSSLEEVADAILSLQGDGITVSKMVEVFENFIAGDDPDGLADHFKNLPREGSDGKPVNAPTISLTAANDHGRPAMGFLRGESVAGILGLGGGFPIDETISIIEMHHPKLNFSNRDTMASSVFLQALPSIEISKAIPFLDFKIIVKNSPVVKESGLEDGTPVFSNGISIYKFLNGEKIETSSKVMLDLISGIPEEIRNPPPILDGVSGSLPAALPAPSVAGMEVFTSPQTLVDGTLNHVDLDASNANFGANSDPQEIPLENKVLDKFRPLMTLQSFNVQVTPATGMLATKSVDVSLVLHDKTRLSQIQPLIIPAQLGDVEFLCEWGWSHPESDPEINPYGALINSMRVREKYGLMNSTYSFTPSGEVNIALKMYTKGAQKATFELVSNDSGNTHPADTLRDLIVAIRTAMRELKQEGFVLNADMGAPDYLGKASSVKGLLSLTPDQMTGISNFIKTMKSNASGTSSSDEWETLESKWSAAEAGVEDFQTKVDEIFGAKIAAVAGPVSNDTPDPYLIPDTANLPDGTPLFNITHNTHVSLAKILLHFLAEPIRSTKRFDEIQLVFYPMNEYAMWARGLNLGQYPINKETFKELILKELQKSPSVTIQKFLNLMKKLFLNFLGDDIYGLSTFYGTDDDGKRVVEEKYTKDEKAKQNYASTKQKVMEACYTAEGDKRFKKPNVQMFVECVGDVQDKTKSILRLHFFDKNTDSYSSYASLWQATSASDMGVIGKYVSSHKSVQHAEANPPKSTKNKDIEKWDALVKERKNRRTDFGKEAKIAMSYFEEAGLLKEFKVQTEFIDANGDKQSEPRSRYRIKGGPDQLRGILAANIPTLKYGTEFSGIINASLSTQSNPAMETIHMQRQMKSGGATPTGAVDDGLPMMVKPVQLSLDTFGCPFINFGQQFFVDFQTNTTIDDIYAVSGVSHTLTPGEFKSSIKLSPLNKLGQFRSMADQFDDAMAVAKETGGNVS